MKKVYAVLVTSLMASSSFANMAPSPFNHALFVSAEGNYTTNSIDSVKVRSISLSRSTNDWGGRIAAGAIHHADACMSYTAEIGWGYYGKTQFNSSTLGINNTSTIYGMDLLVGADYRYNQFDIYAKAGGMNENVKMERKTNLSQFVTGGSTVGNTDVTATVSAIVPEVKVGGIYNFNDQVGISLAYMYVFGSTVNMSYAPSFDGTTTTLNTKTNAPPASLSSIMLGLTYQFA